MAMISDIIYQLEITLSLTNNTIGYWITYGNT
jgi:hypothetical protein